VIQVSAAILIKNGKILLAKRSVDKHLGGFWEFPGGKLENGETAADSLTRELKEEFGIRTEIIKEFHENIHQYDIKVIRLISFLTRHLDGEFILNDHDEIIWVKPNQLLNYNLAPADIPIAEKLINEIDLN
jgi:8-oxo-dGTP diphosphatase